MNDKFVGFRANERHEAKLQTLARSLGITPSAVLRELVENAELRPVRLAPVAVLSAKVNGDAPTFQGERVTIGA